MRSLMLPIVLLVFGCDIPAANNPDPKPGPPAPSDSGTPDDCEAMCDHLNELNCDDYSGAPDCSAACRNIEELYQAGESEMTLAPNCVKSAKTCDEASRCQ